VSDWRFSGISLNGMGLLTYGQRDFLLKRLTAKKNQVIQTKCMSFQADCQL